MKTSHTASLIRVRLATGLLAVLLAGCEQGEPAIVSSTLQVPPNPGDGYGLVKTSDSQSVIRHLGVAGNSLFFEIPWQGLYGMPKYGGNVTAVDRDTKADFRGLVTFGDDLLWLKSHFDSNDFPDDFILRRPAAGGPSTRLRHGDLNTITYNNNDTLIADSSHVYFIAEKPGARDPGGAGFIDVTPITGGAGEQVPLPMTLGLITVAGDYPTVYFTSCQTWDQGCVLTRADVPAGTTQVVASVSDYAQIVGIDADAVYLLDGNRLWSIARTGGTETELIGSAAGIHPGYPAVVDSHGVYFFGTEPGAPLPAGRLMSVPKTGGPLTILGSDARIHQWIPWDVAVDDQFVFVLTSPMEVNSGNEILAFPKTPPPSP